MPALYTSSCMLYCTCACVQLVRPQPESDGVCVCAVLCAKTDGTLQYASKMDDFEAFVSHAKLATLSLRASSAANSSDTSGGAPSSSQQRLSQPLSQPSRGHQQPGKQVGPFPLLAAMSVLEDSESLRPEIPRLRAQASVLLHTAMICTCRMPLCCQTASSQPWKIAGAFVTAMPFLCTGA